MTAQYSEDVRCTIEDYLRTVRDRLRAAESVDVQEVVDNLRGHIERELSGAQQPVSQATVREVLQRLGPPEQVVDESDMVWWRKMVLRFRQGPEDWRLAYLSLGVLIVGLLIAGPLGVIAGFLLSRAALSVGKGTDPAAKRWLIWPSLIMTYAFILFIGLLWPLWAGVALSVESIRHLEEPFLRSNPFFVIPAVSASGGLGMAIWWTLLWVLARGRGHIVRLIFKPFAEHWTARTFGILTLIVWALTATLAVSAAFVWFQK